LAQILNWQSRSIFFSIGNKICNKREL